MLKPGVERASAEPQVYGSKWIPSPEGAKTRISSTGVTPLQGSGSLCILTWASARRTRYSPGYNRTGLRPSKQWLEFHENSEEPFGCGRLHRGIH